MRATENELDLPQEFDVYVIGRELGRGVTGRVYAAEDTVLARTVAIKFISKLDVKTRQNFLREGRAVAQIHHPNVVRIYGSGAHDNRPYFVTELVAGVSLSKVDKPMAWRGALDIAIGIARGLAAVHRCSVVHCDLKPSNIMIEDHGGAKIIDFGLARIVSDDERAVHAPVGTPEYMAPEVWCSEAPSRRSDVYSFGAVLFELLAGVPPFGDVETAQLRTHVPTTDAPALRDRAPDVDPALAQVVARCLRRDPNARFADGDELREALERLQAWRRHTVRADENPYRGLLPFEASHRGLFFGRRSEIDAVVGRLRGEPFVLVFGDSGVGKSSLCRAGVIPAVLDGQFGEPWQSLSIVPGQRPLTALASALGVPELAGSLRETPALLARELRRHAGDGGLLVFIDQAEELITQGDPEEVAALDAGLAPILDNLPGLRLLATARGDFLGRFSTLRLGRDLPRILYFLRPLPPERLRDVIVGPAETIGASFESTAMIDELTAAAAQAGDGALPLLSFALADLWEARDRKTNVIPERAVADMGGVAGALSRRADVVIREMLAPVRAQARSILLRLVTAMGTRVRRSEPELAPRESARTALKALVEGRLVVAHDGEAGPVYELAHECLLTGWVQLRRWLDADAAGRETRERLAADAREWVRLGRPRSEALWQGGRLADAAKLDPASLSDDDLAFLAASIRAARRRKVQRWLAALGAIALVVLAYATPRYLAHRELVAAIANEVDAAREELHTARDHLRASNDVAEWAFAEFDHVSWDFAERLWRGVLRSREQADSRYASATGHLLAALAKDPSRGDLRDLLGDVLLERAALAERVHDHRLRDDLIKSVALYDDADHRRSKLWDAPANVTVRAPEGATITLEPQGQAAYPIGTGTAAVLVPPGSHVVVVEMKGRVPVREPIFVERSVMHSHEIVLDITPPAIDAIPKDFVYVPAGRFLFGEANETDRELFFQTTPLRWRQTQPFLISKYEVTFDDWFVYLDSLPLQERRKRTPTASAISGNLGVTPSGAGQWRIELQPEQDAYAADWDEPLIYGSRAYHITQNWRRFPVLGITAEDAVAYAEWLDRTGRVRGARLCNEVEWERAARGADGRAFPNVPAEGDRWLDPQDANLDFTHGKGAKGPDEVGSHPASMSPYGLLDTVGNAFEWTVAEDGGYVLRGGSYYHDRKSAHLADRAAMPATGHDASIGFRLCATPPLPR